MPLVPIPAIGLVENLRSRGHDVRVQRRATIPWRGRSWQQHRAAETGLVAVLDILVPGSSGAALLQLAGDTGGLTLQGVAAGGLRSVITQAAQSKARSPRP